MVKGSLELIYYNFIDNVFYYEKLNCPVLLQITNAVDNFTDRNNVYLIFDAGGFYIPCKLNTDRNGSDF
jgi:hypothetical protein